MACGCTLSLSLTHSLSHTHSLSLSQFKRSFISLFYFLFYLSLTLSLSHSLSLTLFLSHSLSLSHPAQHYLPEAPDFSRVVVIPDEMVVLEAPKNHARRTGQSRDPTPRSDSDGRPLRRAGRRLQLIPIMLCHPSSDGHPTMQQQSNTSQTSLLALH